MNTPTEEQLTAAYFEQHRIPRRLSPEDILAYELSQSWWKPLYRWNWCRFVAGKFYGWKAIRNWQRYHDFVTKQEAMAAAKGQIAG